MTKYNKNQRLAIGLGGLGCFLVIATLIHLLFTIINIAGQFYASLSLVFVTIGIYLAIFAFAGIFLSRLGLALLITAAVGHTEWNLNE